MGPILGGIPRLKFGSNSNVVCDGDSLTNGFGSGTPYPTQLAALAPLNGQVPVTNVGISGQTIQDMMDNHADVDGAFVDAKDNTLILWGGTNNIFFGQSAATTLAAQTANIAARRAAKNWKKIVLINLIPRCISSTDEAANINHNAIFDAYNATLRDSYKAMGADALVNTRQAGSPFALTGYTLANFAASAAQGWWNPAEGNFPTHLSTAGYGAIAAMVADVLKHLRTR